MVLLSAGIGATPVLAMLHALAAVRSTRQVWWLHAARDGQHHPFAAEVRRLMPTLTHGRSYVCYSRPDSRDRMGEDFDAAGHLSRSVLNEVGVPREADFYLCGPTRFMADMKEALAAVGVAPQRIRVELFNGSEFDDPGCGRRRDAGAACAPGRRRHRSARVVRAQRHRRALEAVLPEHSRSWPRRATFRSAGRAGRAFATTARAGWFRGRSLTDQSRSTSPPTATFSYAAHNPLATSLSICEICPGELSSEAEFDHGHCAYKVCKRSKTEVVHPSCEIRTAAARLLMRY